jgi:cell division transport system permease protein
MYRKAIFLTQEAFRTIRRHKGVMAISVVIMSLSLLMLAVFLLGTDNLLRFVGQAQEEMKIYVYLDDRVGDDQIPRLQHDLLALDEVETVVFISKDQALVEFREQIDSGDDLLSALETNPLPNSFWVTPKFEYRTKESMAYLAGKITQIDGVEEVRYGQEFLDKFTTITRGAYYVDIVVGFIVILSAIFIISNAVRLTVISRRKNIEVLKLVGATNRFITMPFIIEGAFQGGIAALFSLLLLFAITTVSRRVVPDLSFFSMEKSAIYTMTCIAISAIGSYTALRRYLRV